MKIKLRLLPDKEFVINREEQKLKALIIGLSLLPILFALFLGIRYFTVNSHLEKCLVQRDELNRKAEDQKKEFEKFKKKESEFRDYCSTIDRLRGCFYPPLVVECLGRIEDCLIKNGILTEVNLFLLTDKQVVQGTIHTQFKDIGKLVQTFANFTDIRSFIVSDVVDVSFKDPFGFKMVLKYMEPSK